MNLKRLLFSMLVTALIVSMFSCSSKSIPQQPKYNVVADTETVVMKGVLTRNILEKEKAFTWMTENRKYGSADAGAVKIFSQQKDLFTVLIFGGTWCHDSQNILPVFYRLVDKSGFPDNHITLVGVDRQKTAPHNWHTTWNITMVPTFIILQNGKEMGRVVEYGKTGNVEKELADIVAKLQ
jgi:thiol-disulfide isomerase/thioredoxin